MIVAIHQPQYLPWLGYFGKMLTADVFCYLDTVQYKKNEWQNRNRIKTAGGWQWLTVPVIYRFPQKIGEVGIDNTANWRHKHLQALATHYRRAPHFARYLPAFEGIFGRSWESIAELNLGLIRVLREMLGIGHKPEVRASTLDCSEEPTDRLIDICRALGADTYLAGAGGAGYMDFERFAVVRVPFPFTDRVPSKNRPALVLSDRMAFNAPAGHSVMAMITSAANAPWPLDCGCAARSRPAIAAKSRFPSPSSRRSGPSKALSWAPPNSQASAARCPSAIRPIAA